MTPKIKTRQTSKQPISTKQIVALFVHTNQQYTQFLETTKWRDWIWIKTPRVTRSVPGQSWLQSPFSRSCVLFRKDHPRIPLKNHPPSEFLFSHIYLLPQRPKSVPKRKILLSPFFFSSFFKSSNQKKSSQFQNPLQNLPRRVSPSLNSNSKFPCKNTKF